MKTLITIITSIFLLSFTSDKNDNLIIIPGKSLGEIVLDKTTKKEVENYIGIRKERNFLLFRPKRKKI